MNMTTDRRRSTGRGHPSALAIPTPAVVAQAALLRAQAVRRESATLGECVPAFLAWFAQVRRRAPLTVTSYGYDLRSFLRFCNGLDLAHPREITFREVELYISWLGQQGASPKTLNRHLATLRSFWRFLVRESVTVGNPPSDTFSVKEPPRTAPRYLTASEQRRVLATLQRDRTPGGRRDGAVVALGLLAGLRCSEIAGLALTDVDLDGGVVRVQHGKGDRMRLVPIPPRLGRIMRAWLTARARLLDGRPPCPWLFPNVVGTGNGGRQGEALVSRSIFRIVRARVSPLVGYAVWPHLLRHSYASYLRSRGADPLLIGEVLGHAQVSTTQIYSHLPTAQRLADVARLFRDSATLRDSTGRRNGR